MIAYSSLWYVYGIQNVWAFVYILRICDFPWMLTKRQKCLGRLHMSLVSFPPSSSHLAHAACNRMRDALQPNAMWYAIVLVCVHNGGEHSWGRYTLQTASTTKDNHTVFEHGKLGESGLSSTLRIPEMVSDRPTISVYRCHTMNLTSIVMNASSLSGELIRLTLYLHKDTTKAFTGNWRRQNKPIALLSYIPNFIYYPQAHLVGLLADCMLKNEGKI